MMTSDDDVFDDGAEQDAFRTRVDLNGWRVFQLAVYVPSTEPLARPSKSTQTTTWRRIHNTELSLSPSPRRNALPWEWSIRTHSGHLHRTTFNRMTNPVGGISTERYVGVDQVTCVWLTKASCSRALVRRWPRDRGAEAAKRTRCSTRWSMDASLLTGREIPVHRCHLSCGLASVGTRLKESCSRQSRTVASQWMSPQDSACFSSSIRRPGANSRTPSECIGRCRQKHARASQPATVTSCALSTSATCVRQVDRHAAEQGWLSALFGLRGRRFHTGAEIRTQPAVGCRATGARPLSKTFDC